MATPVTLQFLLSYFAQLHQQMVEQSEQSAVQPQQAQTNSEDTHRPPAQSSHQQDEAQKWQQKQQEEEQQREQYRRMLPAQYPQPVPGQTYQALNQYGGWAPVGYYHGQPMYQQGYTLQSFAPQELVYPVSQNVQYTQPQQTFNTSGFSQNNVHPIPQSQQLQPAMSRAQRHVGMYPKPVQNFAQSHGVAYVLHDANANLNQVRTNGIQQQSYAQHIESVPEVSTAAPAPAQVSRVTTLAEHRQHGGAIHADSRSKATNAATQTNIAATRVNRHPLPTRRPQQLEPQAPECVRAAQSIPNPFVRPEGTPAGEALKLRAKNLSFHQVPALDRNRRVMEWLKIREEYVRRRKRSPSTSTPCPAPKRIRIELQRPAAGTSAPDCTGSEYVPTFDSRFDSKH